MRDKLKITNDSFEKFDDMDVSSRAARRPIAGILQEIGAHLTEILRSEVRLASAEIRGDVGQVARASVFMVVSGVFALYAVGFFLLAAVYALQETWPPWASALGVGIGVAIVAAIFLVIGRKKMKVASLRPDKTIQSLEDNVTWFKKQTK
jgi:uncharacterized membrane protein YqjE